MGKLSRFFKALPVILRQPSKLNLLIDDNEAWKKRTPAQVVLQNGFPQVDINELFPGFNETVSPYSFLDGGSLITDLALLKGLARNFKDCVYLEIGTWRGESVANVAAVAKECFTINLPDGELLRLGKSKEYVSAHRFFSEGLKNVT